MSETSDTSTAPPPDTSPPADAPERETREGDTPADDTTDWKAEARKWEQRAKVNGAADKARRDAEKQRDEALAKVKTHEDAQKTVEQRAQEEAESARKRADQLLTRAIRGEIKALAADKFADPDDPGGFLDLTRYANADGDVDTDAIVADLDDLLVRKPHLGKSLAGPRPPAPNRAQGSSAAGVPAPPVAPGLDRLRYAYGASDTK